MRKFKFHFFFGCVAAVLFALTDWLVMWDNSPFYSYFLYHVGLPNFWRKLHTIPFIVGMVVSGNVHIPSFFGYYLAAAIQWFLIGFAGTTFVRFFVKK